MKKYAAVSLALLMLSACDGGETLEGEYVCSEPEGAFGAKLKFDGKGSVLLDFVTEEQVSRSPDLGSKMNVPGEYEIRDGSVVLSYFDGAQRHRLEIKESALESSTSSFSSCVKTP